MSKSPMLTWPGTGEPMTYDPKGYGGGDWKCGSWQAPGRVAGLSADGHSFTAGFTWLSHEGRDPTQADVDALFNLLCEHHTFVAHSIGRGDDISMANHEACCDEASRQRYEQGRRDMLTECIDVVGASRAEERAKAVAYSDDDTEITMNLSSLATETEAIAEVIMRLLEELKP